MKIMRAISLIFFALNLIGCAQNPPSQNILEAGFGDALDYGGIKFLSGPWYSPGTEYGFHIGESQIEVAEASDKNGVEIYIVTTSSCQALGDAIKELKEAVYHSIQIGFGREPARESEILVMDGPTYTLTIHSDNIASSITLEGGGNAQQVSPWVNASFKIAEVLSHCPKAANNYKQRDCQTLRVCQPLL